MKKILAALVLVGLLVKGTIEVHKITARASDAFVKSRVVKLTGRGGLCSGSQIRTASGKDFILSAAHCIGLKDKNDMIDVEDENGNVIQRKVLAEDERSDLMVLEGLPNMKGLPIAKDASFGEHIRTFTHGSGYETWKSEGFLIDEDPELMVPIDIEPSKCNMPKYKLVPMRFGFFEFKVCALTVSEFVTDARITPGSSGGMIVNDSGELMAVASAGGNGWSFLVRTIDINAFLERF